MNHTITLKITYDHIMGSFTFAETSSNTVLVKVAQELSLQEKQFVKQKIKQFVTSKLNLLCPKGLVK